MLWGSVFLAGKAGVIDICNYWALNKSDKTTCKTLLLEMCVEIYKTIPWQTFLHFISSLTCLGCCHDSENVPTASRKRSTTNKFCSFLGLDIPAFSSPTRMAWCTCSERIGKKSTLVIFTPCDELSLLECGIPPLPRNLQLSVLLWHPQDYLVWKCLKFSLRLSCDR